mgnify:CR=1 FL=1
MTDNIAIAYNSYIENAVGGSGQNKISGNAIDNLLVGGAKSDTIFGLAGNDILDGKAAADTMNGGPGNDVYFVDNVRDRVLENVNAGLDDSLFSRLAGRTTSL